MEKCAQSTLQLPSELVVARGNWTLRSRAPCIWQFLFAVWVYSSWRNAWFNSGYMRCVSSWCFWKVVFVKVNSFPEVDSRPALLGPRSLEKCAQFLLRVAWAASRIWQPLLIVSVLRQKVFPVSDTGGVAGSPGVSTYR